MARFAPSLLFIVTLIALNGCLTVAGKEYHIRLHSDGSGTATIRFLDIGSESEDTSDVSAEDFEHLINSYLYGSEFEDQNPGWRNVQKRLYEDGGLLNGELTFEFDSISTVWLYRFDLSGPLMYYVGTDRLAEEVRETNGRFRPEIMPVVFWPAGTTELYLHTRIRSEAPDRRSLAPLFRHWKREKADPMREE
ncbi:MAG: hypothetical protein OEV30_08515 [Ignavibacteria bacterium]|nr:hypothetical protein [Ignavibacteria bacterium]